MSLYPLVFKLKLFCFIRFRVLRKWWLGFRWLHIVCLIFIWNGHYLSMTQLEFPKWGGKFHCILEKSMVKSKKISLPYSLVSFLAISLCAKFIFVLIVSRFHSICFDFWHMSLHPRSRTIGLVAWHIFHWYISS